MGTRRTRTPTASATALNNAGTVGSWGPSPASLAPKGPPGSGPSTAKASMGGVSRIVGMRYSRMDGFTSNPEPLR